MNGTEKQIAWAEEIKARINKAFDAIQNEMVRASAPERNIAYIKKCADALNECEYAGDIISIYKDIRFNCLDTTEEVGKVLSEILAVIRVTKPNTDGEAKLILKQL